LAIQLLAKCINGWPVSHSGSLGAQVATHLTNNTTPKSKTALLKRNQGKDDQGFFLHILAVAGLAMKLLSL
jgi:hypothetical protein